MLEDILSQDDAKGQLSQLVNLKRIPHGLLFYGPPKVGKSKAAMSFLKSLNCRNGGKQPCYCSSCKKIDADCHPDFYRITPNDSNQIVKEQIQQLSKDLSQTRNEGARKVVFIKSAHLMNSFAANALLKTLEEPSEDTTIVLTTSAVNKLLPTIISRCTTIRFSFLSDSTITTLLQKSSQSADAVMLNMMAGTYSPQLIRDEFVLLRHLWDGTVINLPHKVEPEQLRSELSQIAHILTYLLVSGKYQYLMVMVKRPNPDKLRALHSVTERAVMFLDRNVRPLLVVNWFTHRMRELLG